MPLICCLPLAGQIVLYASTAKTQAITATAYRVHCTALDGVHVQQAVTASHMLAVLLEHAAKPPQPTDIALARNITDVLNYIPVCHSPR